MNISNCISNILKEIGEDPNRPGLLETPLRVEKAYKELFLGYTKDPKEVLKCFDDGAEGYDEIIILKDIEFFSSCEHHMLPFTGKASIGYLAGGKIVGISKLARLLDIYAKRLQVQERLTVQITEAIDRYIPGCLGAGCIIEAKHMCISCRGVNKQDSVMVTSSLTGRLRDDPATRSEFLRLVK